MLSAGFGGIVMTAKSDERPNWEAYCEATGRSRSLLVFSPSQPLRFNVFDHEFARAGAGAGITENIVGLFFELLEVAERRSGGGRDEDGYWKRATRQLLRNAIDLLAMAKGRISVSEIYRLVVSAPPSLKEVNSPGWQKNSFCFECLRDADARQKNRLQARDFEIVADYFLVEYVGLSERTRSVIVSTLTSMIDPFNRGVLHELFSGDTNVTPEIIEHGAILVVDLPVKEYGEVGQFAQVLWKMAFQRSIERRNVAMNDRPAFLWADEAQFFTTSRDTEFQTTCRASRVATVLLSQNISNFYAAFGSGEQGRAQADSLFGNLNMKIFHANGDPVTNEWAASLIGRSRQFLVNSSSSSQPNDSLFGYSSIGQNSAGVSEHIDFEVQPQRFTTLRRGGPPHWEVDGIVFQGGRRFRKTGRTWMQVSFAQR
jgi:type IV secretory pathway TraG/TraD family ATPase VirD4